MATASLPVLANEGGLSRYLEEIRRFPMLEPQEEFMLAKRWREQSDPDAARKFPRPSRPRIASAMIERAELPVQRNSTLKGRSTGSPFRRI